jgi:hypothetical protein
VMEDDDEGMDEGEGFGGAVDDGGGKREEEGGVEEEEARGMKPPLMPTRMIWSTVEARWSILDE